MAKPQWENCRTGIVIAVTTNSERSHCMLGPGMNLVSS